MKSGEECSTINMRTQSSDLSDAKDKWWGFPWWSSDWDSALPLQGTLV